MPWRIKSLYTSLLIIWLAIIFTYVVGLIAENYTGGNREMASEITEICTLAAALGSVISVIVTQVMFYRKDSKTMSEIKDSVTSGHEKLNGNVSSGYEKLNDRMEHKQEMLAAEHKEIGDIVKEIRIKQEGEIRLQEKLRDLVPDAGMIKDGIEKICRENMQLKDQIKDLQHEVQLLREQNQRLAQRRSVVQQKDREIDEMEL